MALAVTQPYIAKNRIELIDSNTDPNFNQLLSAHAFLAQAQAALIKLTNPELDPTKANAGEAKASGVDYLLPVYVANEKNEVPPSTTKRDAFKNNVDAAIASVSSAIKNLYVVIADANS